MAKREISGMRTVITGASSGIGRALVVELARQGARCVLVARRIEKLEATVAEILAEIPEAAVEIVAGDITDAVVRKTAIERCVVAFGGLDAVINNAGIGSFGRFADSDPARLRQIMEVNFFAPVELIRAALPALKASSAPIVVNVGSILGHRGIPRMHEYCSSKFALQGLCQSLRVEFRPLGIDLLMVSPGTTETEFYDSVVHGRGEVPWNKGRGVSSATVARKTVQAIRQGKREIVPNFFGRLLLWAHKYAPHLVDRFMVPYA